MNNVQDDPKLQLMKARLKAAELRMRATHQSQLARGYANQAASPAYDGQADVCAEQAAVASSLAEKTRAEADLIEAQAEAAYRLQRHR